MSAASKNASTSESHSTILEPPKPNSPTAELQNLGAATRMDGRNYLQWARLVTLALKGKQKLHHLTEDPPNSLDEKYSAWDIEDTIIMTWLLNSMQLEISQNFMFLETSKQIWEMVKKTYSKAQDVAVVYELKTRIANTKQGNLSVTEYYNLLTNLWQEMDMYRKLKVSEDTQAILREREQDRVFEFLAGLNEAFDHVRVQILGRETLPNLNETFYLTRGEESRRAIMLDSTSNADSALIAERRDNRGSKTDSVFNAARRDNRGSKSDSTKASNRDNLWCTHCKKPRHTRETCFKLHGKEQVLNRIKQQRTQANLTATEQPASPGNNALPSLNEAEVEKLRAFLETLTTSSCSLAQSVPTESFPSDNDHISGSGTPTDTNKPTLEPKEPLKVYSRRYKSKSTQQHVQSSDPTPTGTHNEPDSCHGSLDS
ncbi:hypothetical protein L6164_010644 [Bauhinia variegata]|uniref:Uncharacterized protein n=1 Tax=Bauhinia variegata TaxID=167791 RepID=A0ACB9PQQ2_BAUVA|nr:hypothetical protein L6164_010644 [Bauhinia variegata]